MRGSYKMDLLLLKIIKWATVEWLIRIRNLRLNGEIGRFFFALIKKKTKQIIISQISLCVCLLLANRQCYFIGYVVIYDIWYML